MLTTLLQEAVVRTKLHPEGALVSFLFLLVLGQGQQRLPAAVPAAAADVVPVGRISAAEDSRAAANADSYLRCPASCGAAFFVVVVVVVPAERQHRRPHSGKAIPDRASAGDSAQSWLGGAPDTRWVVVLARVPA